jgi:hypothetical protein
MSTSSRRHFVLQIVAVGTAIGSHDARAQGAGPKLNESDPQAVALGYKDDTTKVDAKKYPKHAPDQKCSNCQLFQGKATDIDRRLRAVPGQAGHRGRLVQRRNKKAG